MKSFLAVVLFLSAQAMAAPQSFEFKCEGPNLHYINQFEMQMTLDFDEELLEDVSIEATIKQAGFETEVESIEATDLTAKLVRVDNQDVFGKVFYMIHLRSKKDAEEKFYGNIVLGYPGLLTSYIRLEGLRQYKSTCKIVE